ncbi:MAG: hypothetical protein EXQ99_03100 [Alphaproteobacteria bacterium]|nr:hypothetical protein [Alphaproteobacteria bacterium]
MPDIFILDSATQFEPRHRGHVIITGSHGGLYPGYLAAKTGVLGISFNDAGIGKDEAGIASLAYLDRLDIPAVTVSHLSARIADGADITRRGVVSHANATATALGCKAGQHVTDAAALMRAATPRTITPPSYDEARSCLRAEPGEPEIWAIDSSALMVNGDQGRIMITGSHGALLAGRPDHIIKGPPLAAFFNDAGIGIDNAGVSRLPALDAMGVIGGAVAASSARIGQARSAWQSGMLSRLNRLALAAGGREGEALQAFIGRLATARAGGKVRH